MSKTTPELTEGKLFGLLLRARDAMNDPNFDFGDVEIRHDVAKRAWYTEIARRAYAARDAEVDALRQQLQQAHGRECGALCRDLEQDRDTLEAERDQLRQELEEARQSLAAVKADFDHSQANCRAAIEHRQASDDQTARLTADLAAARAELDEATKGVRARLAKHYLAQVVCDHERGLDNPNCSCSLVHLGWHPSVGAAVAAWIDHALERAAPAAGGTAGQDGAVCPSTNPQTSNPCEAKANHYAAHWFGLSEQWHDDICCASDQPGVPTTHTPAQAGQDAAGGAGHG